MSENRSLEAIDKQNPVELAAPDTEIGQDIQSIAQSIDVTDSQGVLEYGISAQTDLRIRRRGALGARQGYRPCGRSARRAHGAGQIPEHRQAVLSEEWPGGVVRPPEPQRARVFGSIPEGERPDRRHRSPPGGRPGTAASGRGAFGRMFNRTPPIVRI